jgi:peptidoglycan/LPS O-acetylase OafA/YrhL
MSMIWVPVLRPVEHPGFESANAADASAAGAAIAAAARNPTLDAARVGAALGLIWIHTTQSSLSRFHVLGRFGTSFFVMAAIFFLFHRLGSSPRPTYGGYIWKRFRRLYIPFAAWSFIYFLMRETKRSILHEPSLTLGWGRFIAGTGMQFWFLPFIFLACIICFPLPPLFERMGKKKLLLLPLIIATGAFIALSNRPHFARADEVTSYFLDSAWTFIPSIFWALALAILYPLLPAILRQSRWLAAAGISLTVSCLCYLYLIRDSANPLPSLPRTLAGVGWLLLALVPLRGKLVMLLAPLGKYSYGIFLVHPLFVSSLQAIFNRSHITPHGWLDILVVALAFPASAFLTVMLRSHRSTRWLVP